ncbi:thiamine phosphate synthase [Treponema endosymbiont of Eucomonympha sp.]|uniref:thiamine phosphate synthase n=1 Tax=Treponema endosymbiont of Eucomonympha sp. TaxID=1580831 RepID=UPI000780F857|nr:thiamine phosphate synthase [Treponema endosymbiont of Eucomonympha sp.]
MPLPVINACPVGNLPRKSLLLYLCTDRRLLRGRDLCECVEQAIRGGVTLVQLREKDASARSFFELALSVRAVTKRHGIPLVVNDRLDVALAAGADGAHIGQTDLPLGAARKLAGSRLFIGVSVGTVQEALDAERDGADYVGAGAVFPTDTKADAGEAVGLERLRAIVGAVRIPVVGIGGVNAGNARSVVQTGAAGIALVSGIISQDDVEAAARELKELVSGS